MRPNIVSNQSAVNSQTVSQYAIANTHPMTLESAYLHIKTGQETAFEAAFRQASSIISVMPGYRWHQLHQTLENPSLYLLLVEWETLEDHTLGFRGSPQYQEWRALLHHFYEPFPTVLHHQKVYP